MKAANPVAASLCEAMVCMFAERIARVCRDAATTSSEQEQSKTKRKD